MPFVVWSGAIATAREKHCTAQASLTRSVLDVSCVHADNSDNRNSCNKLPPRLAAVWTVSELIAVIADQIQRAVKTSSHG